ncbi:response regulator [Saccharibacillus sp. CPCC 101409]|uniref:response regulator n=1 Tax=Saccharibacillus sp. CPCC 101409 TaxID=3058041 RepID=UPI0026739926|nr:response regulator [Saccharibacillus sp. CPCC 101409]MDO3413280.1 response regulator [Saccharibacillus sp. CPCC 101409]
MDNPINNHMAQKGPEIRLLIVDDEPVICEGLKRTIDWSALGVRVAGIAYDGEEALGLVSGGVDIVLTDIRMEGMDGLSLAGRLKESFPAVRVVMLSGYEDFDYARRALRLGVRDYLLKPVEIDELTEVIGRIAGELRESGGKSIRPEVELWLAGAARQGAAGHGPEAPPSLGGTRFRILATQLERFNERFGDKPGGEYEELRERWRLLLHRKLEESALRPFSVFDHENRLITLAVSDERIDSGRWDALLEETVPLLKQERLYLAASDPYADSAETGARCLDAIDLLPFHLSEQRILLLPAYRAGIEAERGGGNAAFDASEAAGRLVAAMFRQDEADTDEIAAELFAEFRRRRLLPREIAGACDELAALLRQRLRRSGMAEQDYAARPAADPNLFNSYEALERRLKEELRELAGRIGRSGLDKTYWLVEKARIYMDEHYRTDLKASEVAAWLKITPSYFSYIFKQSTGRGFTEYMNEMRMEQAKNLLATTHDKVFEIADRVGYKEYKYFVSVFKTYTGMTPKEYRGLSAAKESGGRK